MNIDKKLLPGTFSLIWSCTVLSLLTILLIACGPHDKANTTVSDKIPRTAQCIAGQSQCQFDLASGQIQVLFNVEKIVTEQSFNMVVNYFGDKKLTSISGYLEGVDMFMGKIPLFIEAQMTANSINDKKSVNVKQPVNNSNYLTPVIKQDIKEGVKQVFQAEVLVGSCSAQQMTWRIWLTFITSKNETFTKMLTVMSYRS
ncbi:MAG: hypothetical protein ACI89T_000834 [Cognaticolwellia sp.]|jgi:hypothetical protein